MRLLSFLGLKNKAVPAPVFEEQLEIFQELGFKLTAYIFLETVSLLSPEQTMLIFCA